MRFYILSLLIVLALKNPLYAQPGSQGAKGPDFDGDGISDVAGFENQHDGSPNELAITWISSASGAVTRLEYGKAIQSSVPSDYDGDGITDFAIVGVNELGEFLWQYKLSSGDGSETSDIFGIKDDLVLYGCSFDSDAKADRGLINADGLFTYKKSSDGTTGSFMLNSGLSRVICADLDGDGIDEIIGQKTIKTGTASQKKKASQRKRPGKKKKNPPKQPALSEKSYFYVWNLTGAKTLDVQFGSGVKGIIAADTDGNGIKEFGFQKEKSGKRTELIFYNGGAEKSFTVPAYLDVSFHNFTNTAGSPDGFVLKAKADNIFLKYNSLGDLATYQEIFIPRAETVISSKGTTTVGPVVSKESKCTVHLEPNDGLNGFLWKPVSDTTGNVAVHVPQGLRFKKVSIIKDNVILEDLFFGGNGNGARDLWRSRRRSTTFDENITVVGTKGAVNTCWLIPDPRKRYD